MPRPLPAAQRLEERRLFSFVPTASLSPVPVSTSSVIRETVNVPFTADLGNFTYPAPGTALSATVSWGDGTTSTGVIKSDGVTGIDEIKFEVDASHTYAKIGDFPIVATVFQPGVTTAAVDHVLSRFDDEAIVTSKTTSTPLDGTIKGTYSTTSKTTSPTNTTEEYLFNGTGTAGVLGVVSAAAAIDLSGAAASGSTAAPGGVATGTLTLTTEGTTTTAGGSVTLRLTGEPTTKPGAFPSSFTYIITGGTGIFADASGSGTIAVTLGTSTVANSNAFEFVIKSNGVASPVAL